MRTAQLANLEEVKELRAKALQSYNSGSPSLQSALLEAVGLTEVHWSKYAHICIGIMRQELSTVC